jgi:hypothetical protein
VAEKSHVPDAVRAAHGAYDDVIAKALATEGGHLKIGRGRLHALVSPRLAP